MARIHEGMASDGTVILARNQWAGKGQRGKSWLSEPGQNLIMSLISETSGLDLSLQFLFSASVTLGLLDTVILYEKENFNFSKYAPLIEDI